MRRRDFLRGVIALPFIGPLVARVISAPVPIGSVWTGERYRALASGMLDRGRTLTVSRVWQPHVPKGYAPAHYWQFSANTPDKVGWLSESGLPGNAARIVPTGGDWLARVENAAGQIIGRVSQDGRVWATAPSAVGRAREGGHARSPQGASGPHSGGVGPTEGGAG